MDLFENDKDSFSNNNYHWDNNSHQRSNIRKSKNKKIFIAAIIIFFVLLTAGFVVNNKIGFNNIIQNPLNDKKESGTQVIINSIKPSDSKKAINIATDTKVLSIKEIVKKNKPAVVGVVSKIQNSGFLNQGTGSGIIMSQDGYIITNNHVIEGSNSVSVVFSDSREYSAQIIGRDRKSDLAVLKINEKNLTYAEFGDSDLLEEGDLAVAIGNPIGLELSGTVTSGIISAVNRDLTIDDRVMTLLQTDASINPGNSGGPLINEYGQVIGINSIKIALSDTEGLGFAIPINVAKPIIDDLIANGYVKNRSSIGISGKNITQRTAYYYDIPQGVFVDYINPKSNAVSAGLKKGDIIIKINNKTITTMSELNYEKDKFKAGETITLTVYRDKNEININVKLAEEKPE